MGKTNGNSSIDKLRELLDDNKTNIILAIILLIFIYVGYKYYHEYFYILKDPNKVKSIIMSYGKFSFLAFIILQIIQVVFFFIPGEIIQIAGGYIYGTFYGGIISIIGITIGSIIVYGISRAFGKPFVQRIISEKQLKFFDKILRLGQINYIVFLLYLIPGIPKDALAYICGISSVKFNNFVFYSTIGRLPGIFISSYFGYKITSKNIPLLVAIGIVMIILFIIGVIKGEKIIRELSREDKSHK